LKFQVKIILAFTLVMSVILFYMNITIINFVSEIKADIIIEKKNSPNLEEFLELQFDEYLKNMILWELLLVLTLMLILHKIVDYMTKRENQYKDFLELVLLIVSHRFGNFLAAQRGNIDILKTKHDQRALDRLEKSYNFLHDDINRIMDNINRFKEFSPIKEKINLKHILEKVLNVMTISRPLKIFSENVTIYGNSQIIENIILSLFENAVKYSKESIKIRLTTSYLAIRNDVSPSDVSYSHKKGSGIGLKIAEALANKEGYKIKYRLKNDHFIVLFKFR